MEMLTSRQVLPEAIPNHPLIFTQKRKGTILDHLNSFLNESIPDDYNNIDRAGYDCHLSGRALNYIKDLTNMSQKIRKL